MKNTNTIDFKKIFGNKIKKLKPIVIPDNLYGIDIDVDFNDVAVYYSADFTKKVIAPAHILEFKSVKKHGVIPTEPSTDGIPRFNCCVGDYTIDEAGVIIKGLQYGEFDFMSRSAGTGKYADYSIANVSKRNLNKFIPYNIDHGDPYGWYGFFNNIDIAKALFEKVKQATISSLEKKIATISWFSL